MSCRCITPLRWFARWSSVLFTGIAAVYVSVEKQYDNSPPIRSDGCGYHIWTYAILKWDASFSWYEGIPADVALHQPDPGVRRFASKYPPGVALMRLPAMVFVVDPERRGLPYSSGEHWACLLVSAVALIATAAFGLDTCYRLGVSPIWANASVFLLMFGTGLFHYGTYDAAFSHVYSAMLVAALVWTAARAVHLQRPLPFIPVVALAAGLFLVRTTNGLLVGFWVLACLAWMRGPGRDSPGLGVRALTAATIGLLIGIGVTVALNYEGFGTLTLHTYPGEKFVWDDPKMLLVLSGERHGVFRVYPILGVTLLAGVLSARSRNAALGLAVVLATYTVLYGYWWTWQLACGFGHRGFVEVVPFAVPVLALALNSMPRLVGGLIALVGCAAVAYTVIQMWQYWQNRPFIPFPELLSAIVP